MKDSNIQFYTESVTFLSFHLFRIRVYGTCIDVFVDWDHIQYKNFGKLIN